MAKGKRRPRRVTGQEPLSYMGVEATTPPQVITSDHDPTSEQNTFDLGTVWVNYATSDIFMLANIESSVAEWILISNEALTINGDTGSAVETDGEIDIIGSGVLTTAGATNVLTLGMTAAADGQLIIGGSGIDPAWGTVTSSDGTITITGGANTLDITRTGGGGVTDFITDAGTAVGAAAQITVSGGTNINTAGAGNVVTINLDNDVTISGKMTSADLQVTNISTGFLESDAAGNISNSEGTDGQLIIGATGAPGAWASVTSTSGTVQITEGANTLNLESIAGLGSPYLFVGSSFTGVFAGGQLPVAIDNYGATQFVVVTDNTGGTSKIATSATGIESSWTERASGAAGTAFSDIHCGSDGYNVAVIATTPGAPSHSLHYSTDPTAAWTSTVVNPGGGLYPTGLNAVYFDGTYWGLFGEINAGGTWAVYYATDPTTGTWTVQNISGTQLNDAVFGNGTWVTVGNTGKIYYRATDPAGAWTQVPVASTGFDVTETGQAINVLSVAYSSTLNLFVAVGSDARLSTSPDGITWTQRRSGFSAAQDITNVYWDSTKGVFTCVGSDDFIYSYNGLSWTLDNYFDGAGHIATGSKSGVAVVLRAGASYDYSR